MGVAGKIAGTVLGAVGVGTSYLGAKKQTKAVDKATETQAASQQRALEFQKEVYGEAAPFREFAEERLPGLQETMERIRGDVLAAPGESPLYQRGLTRGVEGIQTQLAKYGLADSSVSGRAIGEFTGALSAQDLENVRARRMGFANLQAGLTGFRGAGTSEALQAGGLAQQAGAGVSGLQALSPKAGLYGDIGSSLVSTLPLLARGGAGLTSGASPGKGQLTGGYTGEYTHQPSYIGGRLQ